MRIRVVFLAVVLLLSVGLAACGDDPPPTQIYIVISPTPDDMTPETPEPAGSDATVESATVTPAPSDTSPPEKPTLTPIPPATSTPDVYPTNTVAQVPIAEQVFQSGRMFWIRHTRQIWVMQNAPDSDTRGDWFCFNDTFEDGEMEIDANLIPPAENLYQPRRGFGKLWRNHPEFQNGLGWGVTPEFELTSTYTYIPGGYVENNQYFPGPGEHRLTTLYNETIAFEEGDIRGDCQGGTWRMID